MTRRPRLLDLFCGAGGAAVGYHRAGFEVVGVDINPQPHYPFEFHQTDAMWCMSGTGPTWFGNFDAIHASPPCQTYSITKHTHNKEYPDLVEPIRQQLVATGLPWVMENVIGAPMPNALTLCGTMFDLIADDRDGSPLFLRRHRLFETSYLILGPGPCRCIAFKARGWTIGGVYGGGAHDRTWAKEHRKGGYTPHTSIRRELMGIDWMPEKRLNEAIPPAYTEWIGRQLLAAIERQTGTAPDTVTGSAA